MVVHVTKDKILLSDGVWRAVDNIPMDKIVEWQQVRLEKLGSRLFLILSFWDEGAGETKIQNRHWIVSEVTSLNAVVKTAVKLNKIVQKRTLQNKDEQSSGDQALQNSNDQKSKPIKYLMDKAEKIELKSSDGKVVWRVGRETGVIE